MAQLNKSEVTAAKECMPQLSTADKAQPKKSSAAHDFTNTFGQTATDQDGFFLEQYQQQGYQFADVSPLLKAPLGVEQAAALKADLADGIAQGVSNKQALTELVAALREAELDILPNQGASLRSMCEAWAYEADEFPVSVIDSNLMCSQYVAVMRVMLQVTFLTALLHAADCATVHV